MSPIVCGARGTIRPRHWHCLGVLGSTDTLEEVCHWDQALRVKASQHISLMLTVAALLGRREPQLPVPAMDPVTTHLPTVVKHSLFSFRDS